MDSFDLEPYKQRPEIIRQTVAQVSKDFAMFGMEVHFTGMVEFAYQELFTQLSVHLEKLLRDDYGRLSALLYQVDIGEEKILSAVSDHPDWNHVDVITELVIHRELKKVLTRNYFKNQKSGI